MLSPRVPFPANLLEFPLPANLLEFRLYRKKLFAFCISCSVIICCLFFFYCLNKFSHHSHLVALVKDKVTVSLFSSLELSLVCLLISRTPLFRTLKVFLRHFQFTRAFKTNKFKRSRKIIFKKKKSLQQYPILRE